MPLPLLNRLNPAQLECWCRACCGEKLPLLIKSRPDAAPCLRAGAGQRDFLERQPGNQAALLPQLVLFVQRLVGAPVSVADFNRTPCRRMRT